MKESKYVNYNGKISPANAAVFSLNRAMSYGDGLFESIRLHNGEILFLNEHINRMLHGMQALHMQVPGQFSVFFFHKQLMELAALEQPGGNARLRISIFRSGKGLYEPQSTAPEYFLQVIPMEHDYRWNDAGCNLGVYRGVPKNFSEVSFCKTMNALPYVMAGIYKQTHQFDDCLLLNSNGMVADAISSNIFWIIADVFFSPPVSDGGIDGILRRKIIELLADNSLPFKEVSVTPDELLHADEVFLTNAGWGMKPVTRYKEKSYSTVQTKKLFLLLLQIINN